MLKVAVSFLVPLFAATSFIPFHPISLPLSPRNTDITPFVVNPNMSPLMLALLSRQMNDFSQFLALQREVSPSILNQYVYPYQTLPPYYRLLRLHQPRYQAIPQSFSDVLNQQVNDSREDALEEKKFFGVAGASIFINVDNKIQLENINNQLNDVIQENNLQAIQLVQLDLEADQLAATIAALSM